MVGPVPCGKIMFMLVLEHYLTVNSPWIDAEVSRASAWSPQGYINHAICASLSRFVGAVDLRVEV